MNWSLDTCKCYSKQPEEEDDLFVTNIQQAAWNNTSTDTKRYSNRNNTYPKLQIQYPFYKISKFLSKTVPVLNDYLATFCTASPPPDVGNMSRNTKRYSNHNIYLLEVRELLRRWKKRRKKMAPKLHAQDKTKLNKLCTKFTNLLQKFNCKQLRTMLDIWSGLGLTSYYIARVLDSQ